MNKTQLLTDDFIAKYPDFPAHMNELGKFVYYRTYSRYLPEKKRRETWKETCRRATEYNVGLAVKHLEKIGYTVDYDKYRKEAEEFFDSMFNLRQFLSGRTLWVGGADGGVAEKYPLSNFNCFSRDTEFITDNGVRSFEDFNDGDKVNVLVKTGGWREATVRNFGKSEIVELTVRKGRRVETISTTANHLWFVNKGGKWREVRTDDLKPGDVLRTKKRYETTEITPCPKRTPYKVESVEFTGRFEDVWCVQEPDTQTFTLANGILTHNCSYVTIRSWDDLGDLFYLLLVGTGVGFKSTKKDAANMAPIRTNVKIVHEPYVQRYPIVKQPDTQYFDIKNEEGRKIVIHVGDSKEGWVEALRLFFRVLTTREFEDVNQIGIFYDYIRPKGARLHTFGGTASGPEPLREMFEGIEKVLRNELDPSLSPLEDVGNGYKRVRPIHILDIGNLIGNNVVVGGKTYASDVNKNPSLSVEL
mgnify:CR=1 FL=1